MNFDPTISIGNILDVLVYLTVVGVAFWRIASRLTNMERKINFLWAQFKKDHNMDENGKEGNLIRNHEPSGQQNKYPNLWKAHY